MSFKKYLENQGYASKTVSRKLKHLARYERWLSTHHYKAHQIDYRKALAYLSWERSGGIADTTLHHYFSHVKNYYDYLLEVGQIKSHPFSTIQLKKKLGSSGPMYLQDLLKEEELDEIYTIYCSNKRLNKRDKILLGLLVYQGLGVAELSELEVSAIDLENAKIEVPASKMYASRSLSLAAKQILPLSKYLVDKSAKEVLISYASYQQGVNSRMHLCDQIRRELKKSGSGISFRNLRQLRRSVIADWVSRYNLREAQYMAGHRSVYSTERYQVENIEALIEEVSKYHPLEEEDNQNRSD